MSTATRYPSDFGYAGLTMTADDYLALGETADRYELVHGVVLMSPSPLPIHSRIARRIDFQLTAFEQTTGRIVSFGDTDVRFDDSTVYRPDISVYLTERLPKRVNRLQTPPDLVIEVLSPSNRGLDLMTKRNDYERYGVGEYWIVDPANGDVRGWKRVGVRFEDVAITGDSLPSSAIPGFTLDLHPIRALARGEA
jgi:Uma2 family endonuclease